MLYPREQLHLLELGREVLYEQLDGPRLTLLRALQEQSRSFVRTALLHQRGLEDLLESRPIR